MTSDSPDAYDAVVIGSGAGGGVVACVLAEAGQRVLLLERGQDLSYEQVPRDHLRNHRSGTYGNNTGPGPDEAPRVFVPVGGVPRVVKSHEFGYHNNAMTLGGGTRVYGAQAWRFHPDDFRMASRYGVPAGSSLADWPIGYDELAPYYERAEWELGVAGDSAVADPVWRRSRAYPLPPPDLNPSGKRLRDAADTLGWATQPVPLLVNTRPYNGRPACVQCGNCVGFACPSDGKTGSQNTVVPRALRTGLCTLLTGAQAERIDTEDRGRVTGVTFVAGVGGKPRRTTVRAKRVIVACGAIESARLLLNSSSRHHPSGLGNASDQVGRHLQGHVYVGAYALFPERVYDGRGPGVTIATTRFTHGNAGIIGGGLLANEFCKTPLAYASAWPPDVPRWGAAAKHHMRQFVRHDQVQGPVQEIPSPDARVTIDPAVRDEYGIPVVRLTGSIHPATLDVALFMREKAIEWARAAGAEKVWSYRPVPNLSGGQHQAGTCRMGNDPHASVTDPWGRVHGHDNLFVADGSLHVTNGGFNPVLTIFALAYRVADDIVRAG